MSPYCFILSWERPIYLWATLYSLYRNTSANMNYVLVDNASKDPLVSHVIRSFERRGMFAEVRTYDNNSPKRLQLIFNEYADRLGEYFFFTENDVIVPELVCWASAYEEVFRAHSRVGMVGSLCEPDDFVDRDTVLREMPKLSSRELEYYVRAKSCERDAILELSRDLTTGDFPNSAGASALVWN